MEGLNVVCTWNSQRRTFYFQISSSLFCLYSVLLSSGEAFKWMNSFCWYCTQAFLEKAFSSDISNSGLQVLLLSQSMCSPRHPDTGFTFVEITLKEQPREDGMWNNCGTRLMFVACQCRSAQPYTFFSIYSALRSPFTAFDKKRGIVGMQEDCFHSAAIKPLQMEREWPFVLFCFGGIFGIRLHIRADHNCLLIIGELLVFHLKSAASVRFQHWGGGGCSRG